MWHDESDATSISSGSTASSRDSGSFTTCGDDEPGIDDAAVERDLVRARILAVGEGCSPRSQVTVAV